MEPRQLPEVLYHMSQGGASKDLYSDSKEDMPSNHRNRPNMDTQEAKINKAMQYSKIYKERLK